MLILTRRIGESIRVGDDIVVTIFEVRGDAVRVGIDAPRSVQVHRQEVYDELKKANAAAASSVDDTALAALSLAVSGAVEDADSAPAQQSPDADDEQK